MKHGDIANHVGITVGFRCEDFLIKFKKSSLIDRVLNRILGEYKRVEIDQTVSSLMEHLYRNTDMNVDLIVMKDKYKGELKDILDSIPYNRLVIIEKESQIAIRLITGDLTYYVDSDTYRLSLINSRFAMTLKDFLRCLGRYK